MHRTVRRKIKSPSADRITDEKRCYRFDRCDYWACRSLSEVATYSINTGVSRASDRYARCCVLVKIRPINNRCTNRKGNNRLQIERSEPDCIDISERRGEKRQHNDRKERERIVSFGGSTFSFYRIPGSSTDKN